MKEERLFGGIGAILLILGAVPIILRATPNISVYLEIIGLILLFVAISKMSKRFNNREIYNRFLVGFIASIITSITSFFSFGLLAIGILGEIIGMESRSTLSMMGVSLTLFVITYILSIISAYNWRKSFNIISSYTKVGQFNTAGSLYFWGAITYIILIGILISFIGDIFLAVAFFNLSEIEALEEKSLQVDA